MSENSMKEKQNEDLRKEYYSVLLNAWIATSLELDKSLLVLSSAGIGIAVSILCSLKIVSNSVFWLLQVANVFFALCIGCVLYILHLNKKHLENIRKNDYSLSSRLSNLDKFAYITYVLGVVTVLTIGIVVGRSNLSKIAEEKMNKKEFQNENSKKQEKSFSGFEALKPDVNSDSLSQEPEAQIQTDNELDTSEE